MAGTRSTLYFGPAVEDRFRLSLRRWTAEGGVDRYYKEPLPFEPSRPGTWTVASVHVNGTTVTAISLYGLLDERSDASVHRSLSELSPIFDHKTYRKHLLLGGDLNILANPRPDDPVRDRHLAVLSQIRTYGLVDCLEKALLGQDRASFGGSTAAAMAESRSRRITS